MNDQELPQQRSRPEQSPLRKGAANVLLVSVWLFAAGIALQVYFAGAGILVDPTYFRWHVTFAHLLEAMFLVLLIAGIVGKVGRNALGWIGMLFLLYTLQYTLVNGFAGPARALHAVNALVMFLVALHLGRRQWRVARDLAPNADGASGDRLRRYLVIAILVLVPVVVLSALLTPKGASAQATASESATAEPVAGSIDRGAEIYQSRCSACHRESGEGGVGPSIAGGRVDSHESVVEQILNGGGGMPAFRNQLSDEQIASVASFVGTSWGNDLGPVSAKYVEELR